MCVYQCFNSYDGPNRPPAERYTERIMWEKAKRRFTANKTDSAAAPEIDG